MEMKMKRKDDMYYWIRRAITPTWHERFIDWLTGRSKMKIILISLLLLPVLAWAQTIISIDVPCPKTGTANMSDGTTQTVPFSCSGGGTTAQQIVDNGGSGYSETGPSWTSYNADGYGGSLRYQPTTVVGNATAQFSFTTTGSRDVFATWTGDSSHPTAVKYDIFDGATLLITATVNQTTLPVADRTIGGKRFQKLATVTVATGPLRVVLSNQSSQAGKFVIADAIAVE